MAWGPVPERSHPFGGDCARFNENAAAQEALQSCKPVAEFVEAAAAGHFAVVFLPGGRGTLGCGARAGLRGIGFW